MSIGRLFQKRPIRTKLDIYDLSNLKQTNNEIIYYYMSLYIQQALQEIGVPGENYRPAAIH
jgi:hypothetical protein